MQSNPIANCLRNNQSHCHRDFIDVFLLRFVCLFVAGLDIAKICMFLGLHCIFFFQSHDGLRKVLTLFALRVSELCTCICIL